MIARALVLFVGLAATAGAQIGPPEAERSRPTTGQRILLVAGAVGGGLLVGVTLPPAAPVGIAAGTYATGAALGLDPSVGPVLVDTAIGTAVAVGVAMVSYYALTEVAGADGDLSASLGTAALGLFVGSATTGVLCGLRVVPLAAPTGERGVGLRLGITL